MFKNFFKKAKVDRNINQLIYDIAEYQREEDYKHLYRLLTETELYFFVEEEFTKNIPRGENYTTKSEEKINTFFVEIQGLNLILFFTSQNDKRLGENYFGINGMEALKMALNSEECAGLLIQNNDNSWVGFDKEKIKWILSNYSV